MTYGYRRPPFGNQARLSTGHGRTWSERLTISADGNSGDIGSPSTVKLPDGSSLTVWYVKLIQGVKITDYCDQHDLTTSERLNLFIQVCHAIQHAHQKGKSPVPQSLAW